MKRTYEHARVLRAVDGDTFEVVLDLGFSIIHTVHIRIKGIDAEEMHDKDAEKQKKAQEQKAVAQKLEGKDCVVVVYRQERYGRWESDLIVDGVLFTQ